MKKVYIFLFIAIAFFGMCGWRIAVLNQKYPPPKVERYRVGETAHYNGMDIDIQESYFLSEQDIDKYFSKFTSQGYQAKCLAVQARFSNNGTENVMLDLSQFRLVSGGWSNGINFNVHQQYNNPEAVYLMLELAPGEEYTTILTYSMLDSHFEPGDWESVEDRQYTLVLSLYPIKRVIEL